MARKGDRVIFQIAHVYLPAAHEVLAALTEETEVRGTIVDFSDGGGTPQAFAVVRLYENQTVVVPVERLRVANLFNSEAEKNF